MRTDTEVQMYDDYGTFIAPEGHLIEVVPANVLEHISGGFLNGGCNGNLLCGNLINVGLCVNAGCDLNLRDAGCVGNAVCPTGL